MFIGHYRELYPENTDYPWMIDHFEDKPYPGQGKIIYFLMHGIFRLIGDKKCYDVFTGEIIGNSFVLLSYGDYQWWKHLAHYVKKYNLRLPAEFESYVLSISSKTVYENYRKHYDNH